MSSCFQRYSKGLARCSKVALTMLACTAGAGAQPFDLEPRPVGRPGYVVLESVGPDAVIVVDGEVVRAQHRGDDQVVGPLAVGERSVTVWPDGIEEWNGREALARVTVRAADTVRVRPELPARMVVTSVPYGAAVRLERGGASELLGVTPLTYDADEALAGTLTVEREGYMPVQVEADGRVTQRYAVLLQPAVSEASGDRAPGVYTYGEARVPGRRWIDYAAAGLAVAGAATAIYYKFEADALDDRYRDQSDARYSDEALLDEAQRLDAVSLVGLGAMQVGVGVLAVRFVLR